MYPLLIILLIVCTLLPIVSNNIIHFSGVCCFPLSGIGRIMLEDEVDGLLLVAVDGTFRSFCFHFGPWIGDGCYITHSFFLTSYSNANVDFLRVFCRVVDVAVTLIGGGFISDRQFDFVGDGVDAFLELGDIRRHC